MTSDAFRAPPWRLGLLLWAAAMLGVVALLAVALPQLGPGSARPVPPWVVWAFGTAQNGVLVALAVWSGVALAHPVGLRAPLLEAAAAGQPLAPALRAQIVPGLVAGLAGGIFLFTLAHYAPAGLASPQLRLNLPLFVRVLYGGITEEVLVRWGVMSLVLWLIWRVTGRRGPTASMAGLAIVATALLFGAAHLPLAMKVAGGLSAELVTWVIAGNTAFGVVCGALFWRYGLEAAILAHGLAHVVAYAVAALAR